MNHHNSVLRMTHEYAASREAFERLTQIMCTEVSIPVSDRYNAIYGEQDLHHSLTLLSIEGRYAESGMRRLVVEASSTRVPSGSWVRDAVSRLSETEVSTKVERALDSTLSELRGLGVFNEPVVCAMDKHQIPRYDMGMEPFLTRGQEKAGTFKFETYATLQCVEEGRRAQLACAHVGPLDDNADVIAGLLEKARLREVEVSLLLLDREFFSASCMARLERGGQRYLMPCKLTSRTKQAIREHAEGKRRRVSRCKITSTEGREGAYTIVILPRRGCEEESDPLKRYIAFATNIPRRFVMWNVSRLPDDFRKRWGIETGYAGVEGLRARTTSKSHALRLLYFYYALVLYNAWLLANLIIARRFSKILVRPIIQMQILKVTAHMIVVESFGG
ncbi:MAG: transposase [Candidatus Sulfotelmatobacter sp.]